jgi:hypothetical protein
LVRVFLQLPEVALHRFRALSLAFSLAALALAAPFYAQRVPRQLPPRRAPQLADGFEKNANL